MKIINSIITFLANLLSNIGIFIINKPILSALICISAIAIISLIIIKLKS